MVLFLNGSTFVISLMVAGNDMADHDRKNTAPTKTACHEGTKMTIKYPTMAKMLKTRRARLVPILSER